MPVYSPWSTVYHLIFAKGFTRIPFYLSLPLMWQVVLHPYLEAKFNDVNSGHTQKDIWYRLEAKVKAMEPADE